MTGVDKMTDAEFQRICNFVYQKCGITLTEKKVLVEGRLEAQLAQAGYEDYTTFMNAVESDITGKKPQRLVNILTTNHTYFMREPEHFVFFRDVVLPELKRSLAGTKDLRIWCGASSTGEEPYTLAMIMYDFFALDNMLWDTQLLATDISTDVLRTAIQGRYDKDQIEALPEQWKRRYFKEVNEEQWEVKDEIKKQVLFRQFNLMSTFPFKKQLHVVFLRNVMIYFDKETKTELLKKIYDNLAPGGYLFVGTTEAVDRVKVPFKYVQPSVYKK